LEEADTTGTIQYGDYSGNSIVVEEVKSYVPSAAGDLD